MSKKVEIYFIIYNKITIHYYLILKHLHIVYFNNYSGKLVKQKVKNNIYY